MDTVGNLIQWLQSHRVEMAWFAMGAVVGQYVRVDKLLRLLKRWVLVFLVVGVLVSGEVANAQSTIGTLGPVTSNWYLSNSNLNAVSFTLSAPSVLTQISTQVRGVTTSGSRYPIWAIRSSLDGSNLYTDRFDTNISNNFSWQVHSDTINITLNAGTYYLVIYTSSSIVDDLGYFSGGGYTYVYRSGAWSTNPLGGNMSYEITYQSLSPTNTPTNTPVPTNTNTPLPTNTPVPTNTNTPLPTNTPVPTNTNTPLPTNTPVPTNTTPQPVTDTPIPTLPPTATPTPVATEPPSIVDGYPVLGGGFWDYPVPNFWGLWSAEEVSFAIGGRAMLSGSSSNVLNFAFFSGGFSLYYLLVPGGATVETCIDSACVNFDTNGANTTGRVDIGNLEPNTLKRVSVRSISGFSPLYIDGVYIYEDDPIMQPTALPTATVANWRVEQSFDYLGEELTGYTDLVVTAGDVMLISIMAFGLIVGVAILVVVQSR